MKLFILKLITNNFRAIRILVLGLFITTMIIVTNAFADDPSDQDSVCELIPLAGYEGQHPTNLDPYTSEECPYYRSNPDCSKYRQVVTIEDNTMSGTLYVCQGDTATYKPCKYGGPYFDGTVHNDGECRTDGDNMS